ncbi:hypothetical protein EIN_412480 [Entamoeba invadens IP1]|uniref:Uncharacterized protein n=1 Tax=Entamoeba invadens IP1 TaxID=370355 RepID=A0A0A1UFE4_ENTIV|nr:hypothetical protein EIN_412480 [Entamoeba invadens IP1]ELP95369.1 hypothetical protein EIN_412480 [Entamoeba invadens IP1]|eukprot:XP_004262140.1 hypothetical protein EIN_412480 [Entamoeba invadens IP1]
MDAFNFFFCAMFNRVPVLIFTFLLIVLPILGLSKVVNLSDFDPSFQQWTGAFSVHLIVGGLVLIFIVLFLLGYFLNGYLPELSIIAFNVGLIIVCITGVVLSIIIIPIAATIKFDITIPDQVIALEKNNQKKLTRSMGVALRLKDMRALGANANIPCIIQQAYITSQ